MADLLQGNDSPIAGPTIDDAMLDYGHGEEAPSEASLEGVDFDVIRQEVAMEIADFSRDDASTRALIHQGQHIKAQIKHKNVEKAGPRATIANIDRVRVPC